MFSLKRQLQGRVAQSRDVHCFHVFHVFHPKWSWAHSKVKQCHVCGSEWSPREGKNWSLARKAIHHSEKRLWTVTARSMSMFSSWLDMSLCFPMSVHDDACFITRNRCFWWKNIHPTFYFGGVDEQSLLTVSFHFDCTAAVLSSMP